MKIVNTADSLSKPPLVMVVYGEGGVGKSTFASTAPRPILADCEGGTKYFGLRGIKMDVAQIGNWSDMKEFLIMAKTSDKYDTVIIDPIGELMGKLKRYMGELKDAKLVQKDGSPTMAGWGWLKSTMRMYLQALRDAGKHVIIIAHVAEVKDEDKLIKRPMIETKLSEEIINMVDVVGYMTVVRTEEQGEKRVIIVDPGSDRYLAKDRTGQLGKFIPPDFALIVNACQGNEQYAWSSPEAKTKEAPKTAPVAQTAPVATPVAEAPASTPAAPAKEAQTVTDEETAKTLAEFAALGDTAATPTTAAAVAPVVDTTAQAATEPRKVLKNPYLEAARAKMASATNNQA